MVNLDRRKIRIFSSTLSVLIEGLLFQKRFCYFKETSYHCNMKYAINLKKLSEDLIRKRSCLELGIRAAAKEVGISAATLSRLENGKIPDTISYAHCCKWLKTSLDTFIIKSKTIKL